MTKKYATGRKQNTRWIRGTKSGWQKNHDDGRAAGKRISRRRRFGKKFKGTLGELVELYLNSDVPITKCPPGHGREWRPSWMK